MDFCDIVREHNRLLAEQAGRDPFLEPRLKARLKSAPGNPGRMVDRLGKSLLAYACLLLVFTLCSLFAIGLLEQKQPTPGDDVFALQLDDLGPDYPGSVSLAYLEVARWQE